MAFILLKSRQVWALGRGTAAWTGLADPPSDFKDYANAVIHSDRIKSLLF